MQLGTNAFAINALAVSVAACLQAGAQTDTAAGAALPRLWIELGAENRGNGLAVPSAGDGVNGPVTLNGREARRTDPDVPGFLYVRVEHPAYAPGPREVYVTVDLFDDAFRRVTVQYDRADPKPSLGSKYTRLPKSILLTGSGTWVRRQFRLPQLRLERGQNNLTDFRLSGSGLAVGRIEVTATRPAGFREEAGLDRGALAQLRVTRAPGMELTFGNDAGPDDARLLRALSVTSVESYVDWAGVEPEEGQWDWSKWDRQVDTLEAAGLKWVPFLLVGMPYATPMWFQNSAKSHYYECLEHGRKSCVQSLFNPHLPHTIDRYVAEFARQYRDRGIVESLLLGITGIYGESIYPAGPDGGGWTARLNGPYHNHMGWWAGDPLAVADFRQWLGKAYGTVAKLNAAWGTTFAEFASVSTFLPDDAANDRARSDMAEWYQQAMTDWAVVWVRVVRRHFPDTPIYLCTGGRGTPELGADFTAQAKAIQPYGAGIRITNEGSNYAANFGKTREVATATQFYGTYAGFEPAGRVDANGVVARIYNATASGVRQLHFYHPNVLAGTEALQNYRTAITALVPRVPRLSVAVYVSRETWNVDADASDRMYGYVEKLRDVCDFHMVTRQTVRDGILDKCRALLLLESAVLEPAVAAQLETWVRNGGVLVVGPSGGAPVASRLHELGEWRNRILGTGTPGRVDTDYQLDGEAPAHWSLHVGAEADADWLVGDWHGRERAGEWPKLLGARKRWSGAEPGIRLPVRPGVGCQLLLAAHVTGHGTGPNANVVKVNGIRVGRLDRVGSHDYSFPVPSHVLGAESVANLTIAAKTWSPADHGSQDQRRLGVAVHRVTLVRNGVGDKPPVACRLVPRVNAGQLAACVRRIGGGMAVDLSGQAAAPAHIARLVAEIFTRTDRYLPDTAPIITIDGKLDGRYTTAIGGGTLCYDGKATIIRTPE